MKIQEIISLVNRDNNYNLHSHTQFCDGHAPMAEIAAAAADSGMHLWGITPHSPICIESPCNMKFEDVDPYLAEAERIAEQYDGRMTVLTGMEIDFLSRDFGPHIDYFQRLPLHYRIGSVHFVADRQGTPHDCDGSTERFKKYLHDYFHDDLRFVVEKYFEHLLQMQELGGFEILGHFDKIAGNAAGVDPAIETNSWYEALIDDVISHAQSREMIVEINTKALASRQRFYPNQIWWPKLKAAGLPIVFNSDAHEPALVSAGRKEAISAFMQD